jgi:quinol-cytochrome oxidoreductase complex cytochrome b subunit
LRVHDLLRLLRLLRPNYLGHADNYIEANPLVTPAHIVPEWYFLPFYAILRAVPDKLGGVILMFGSIAVLFVLPWLDTSKVRSGAYRPLFKQFFWIFAAVCVGLGYLGAMPAEGIYGRRRGTRDRSPAMVVLRTLRHLRPGAASARLQGVQGGLRLLSRCQVPLLPQPRAAGRPRLHRGAGEGDRG